MQNPHLIFSARLWKYRVKILKWYQICAVYLFNNANCGTMYTIITITILYKQNFCKKKSNQLIKDVVNGTFTSKAVSCEKSFEVRTDEHLKPNYYEQSTLIQLETGKNWIGTGKPWIRTVYLYRNYIDT